MASGLRRLFERFGKGTNERSDPYQEDAFGALLRKFQNIRYLVEQKATIDVIEKAPLAICITNEDHLYEYVNPAYCRLYGYEFDELIGKSFLIVVPEDLRTEMSSLHDQFMNREYELEGTWEVVTKGGSRCTILANAAYVVDEHGKPKKVTFVLDITQRMEALARIGKMVDEGARLASRITALADRVESQSVSVTPEELRSFAGELGDLLS